MMGFVSSLEPALKGWLFVLLIETLLQWNVQDLNGVRRDGAT
jgi:hypothetical protein